MVTRTFDFSEALQLLKHDFTPRVKVARTGWNGRNMWIAKQDGYPDGIAINENTAKATGLAVGTTVRFAPYLMLHSADGTMVPWLPSQTDLMAEDWVVV